MYIPENPDPVIIPRDSEALYLLQRIRDESHRFAVSYHRNLRNKEMKESILDGISGLGPTRKQKLLQHFGSIEKIRRATVEDLLALAWLPDNVGKEVFEKCLGKR